MCMCFAISCCLLRHAAHGRNSAEQRIKCRHALHDQLRICSKIKYVLQVQWQDFIDLTFHLSNVGVVDEEAILVEVLLDTLLEACMWTHADVKGHSAD